jgi:hypothetical protein
LNRQIREAALDMTVIQLEETARVKEEAQEARNNPSRQPSPPPPRRGPPMPPALQVTSIPSASSISLVAPPPQSITRESIQENSSISSIGPSNQSLQPNNHGNNGRIATEIGNGLQWQYDDHPKTGGENAGHVLDGQTRNAPNDHRRRQSTRIRDATGRVDWEGDDGDVQ